MKNAASRTVLVTGAGGFIGRHLVDGQLELGRRVIATDIANLAASDDARGLVSAEVDLRDTGRMAELLHGVEVVFHLAAAHLDVLKDESYFREINVRATADLFLAARTAGVRRFVHCSSVGVLGQPRQLPADESTPPRPEIPYERTKLDGEEALMEQARAGGLELVILRPAWVYGPGCPRTLKLIRTISRRRFFLVGGGDNLRHPIYVSDMTRAFELAAGHPGADGEIFIIAGPAPVSIRRLIDRIAALLEMDYSPVRLPYRLVAWACSVVESAAAAAGREPPFSRRSLKFFTDSAAFDCGKAAAALSFTPQVELDQGLRLTIEHYRKQGTL